MQPIPPPAAPTQPSFTIHQARRLRRRVVTLLMLVASVSVLGLWVWRFMPVTVVVDGEARMSFTTAATVGEALAALGHPPQANDLLTPSADTSVQRNMRIELVRARELTLIVNGQRRIIQTTLTNPTDILESVGVALGPSDFVLIDSRPVTADAMSQQPAPEALISVRQPSTVRVWDDGEPTMLHSLRETVGEALYDAGVQIYLADHLSVTMDTPLTQDMDIVIERARAVTIRADGEIITTRTRGETVADALEAAGIVLTGLDYTQPPEDARTAEHINVFRVEEIMTTSDQILPHSTIIRPDSTLPAGQTRIIAEGQDGIQRVTTRIRYENERVLLREVATAFTLRQSTPRIIARGTAP